MKKAISAMVLLLLLPLAGCAAPAAKSPAYHRSGGVQVAGKKVANAPEEDRDADGIPDMADKLDEGGRAEMAPAKPMLGAPANPGPAPADRPPPDAGKDTAKAPAEQVHEAERSLVIYTANITMAVYQVEQGILAVEKIAKDNGGFLAQKGDRAITIRVPRARFEPAIAAVDKVGDVIHRDIQAQDVTDEYVDLEIRIRNARAMRTRLQTLLERANVKEALEIEKELNRVTQELELLEGKIKLLKDKVAYSTITVTFAPRGSALQASKIRLPFPWLSQLGLPNLLTLSEDK